MNSTFQQFTIDEAIKYCKDNDVNMLISNDHFLFSTAKFKLFKVTPEENLVFYLEDSIEDEDQNCIDPMDLKLKKVDTVWLDVSEVRVVTNEHVNDLMS